MAKNSTGTVVLVVVTGGAALLIYSGLTGVNLSDAITLKGTPLNPSGGKPQSPSSATTSDSPGSGTNVGSGKSGVVAAAEKALAQANRYSYAQVRPIPSTLFPANNKTVRTDCSGFAKLCYREAGLPSPDGLPWGVGNTSTLQARGTSIEKSELEPGDLAFYKSPDHVSVYVGNGQCIEFGGNPIKKLPVDYRVITACRRYGSSKNSTVAGKTNSGTPYLRRPNG